MILVTGACGHIGNVLVRALVAQGHTKLRLFVLPGEDTSHVEKYAYEIVRGDIRDKKAVSAAVKDCEVVFHLAGIVTVSNRNKSRVIDINYGGTKNVADACTKHGVKRLVYVSTTDALKRAGGEIVPTPETDMRRLRSVYAKTKAAATRAVIKAAQNGLDAVVVYPSAVIGPYDYQRSMSGNMIRRYMKQGKTQFYFDGTYDFVDVRDAADGIIKAWQNGTSGQGSILAGNACSIEEIIGAVSTSTGRAIAKRRLPIGLVYAAAVLAPIYSAVSGSPPIMSKNAIDVLREGAAISGGQAAQALGFSARPLQSTIDDTVEWMRAGER